MILRNYTSYMIRGIGIRGTRSLKIILMIFCAISLTACIKKGVSEDESANSNPGINAHFCEPGYQSYEDLSENGFGCRSSSINGNNNAIESQQPAQSHSVSLADFEEYEPNNTLDNANVVAFPIVSDDRLAGIEISGAVLGTSDESDFFILTPDHSENYAIYLCEATCAEHPTDNKVAIQVFDQFGELIAGNPLYVESTKIVTADLDMGLPYYVKIIGFDTEGQEYAYRLVIID